MIINRDYLSSNKSKGYCAGSLSQACCTPFLLDFKQQGKFTASTCIQTGHTFMPAMHVECLVIIIWLTDNVARKCWYQKQITSMEVDKQRNWKYLLQLGRWFRDDMVEIKDIFGEPLFGGSGDLVGHPPGQAEHHYPTEHISFEGTGASGKPCPLHCYQLEVFWYPCWKCVTWA